MTQLANPTIALFSSIKQRIMARKTDKFVELATLQEHSENVSRPMLSTLMRLGFITCVPLCESGTRIYLLSAGKEHVNSSIMDIKTTVVAESLGLRSIYSKTPGAKAIKDIAIEAGELAGNIAAENILEQDHVVIESVQNCSNPFDQANMSNYNEWNQAWMSGWNKGYEMARQTLTIASDCVGETLDHPWNKPQEKEQPIEEFNDNEVFHWAWGDEQVENNRPLTVAETNAFFDGTVVQEGFFGDLVKNAAKAYIADKIRDSGQGAFGKALMSGLADKFESNFSGAKINPYLPANLSSNIENELKSNYGSTKNVDVLGKISGKGVTTNGKTFAVSADNTLVFRIEESAAQKLAETEHKKYQDKITAKQDAANARISPEAFGDLQYRLELIKAEIAKLSSSELNQPDANVEIGKIIKRELGDNNYNSVAKLNWIRERINPFIEQQKKKLAGTTGTPKPAGTPAPSGGTPAVAGKIGVKVGENHNLDNLLIIAENMILQEAPANEPVAAEQFVDIAITGCIETIAAKGGEQQSARAKLLIYILPPAEFNSYPSVLNQRAGGGSQEIVGSPINVNAIGTSDNKLAAWLKMAPGDLKPLQKKIPAIDDAVAGDIPFFKKSINAFILNPAQAIVKK